MALTALSVEAEFIGGDPVFVDHVAAADIAVGEVVVEDASCFIAHLAAASGDTIGLAGGQGLYKGVKDGTTGPIMTKGERVYFIPGSDLFTNVAEDNIFAGICIEDAGTNQAWVNFKHIVDGTVIVNEST